MKLVDLIIEVRDARAPIASGNNKLDELLGQKYRLIVLNKSDLISNEELSRWDQWFSVQNIPHLFVNSFDTKGLTKILTMAREITAEKWLRFEKKGIVPPPLRIMIVGIPNTGKSTLINRLVSKKAAKTGNKPGVTRAQEWVILKNKVELLDTPGIMPPKIDNQDHGLWLSAIHSIKDDIVGRERIAKFILGTVSQKYPQKLSERYQIESVSEDQETLLIDISEKLAFKKKGGDIDINKTCEQILRDFREGTLGRFCMESPPDL